MKTKLFLVPAVAAALAIAAGIAYATIPDDQGMIHACYKTSNGQLRVIDTGGCNPSETSLSWSQAGPQGPPGPQGEAGSAGVLGFYTKQKTIDLPPQTEVFDGLDCVIGDNATGAGYEPINADVRVAQFAPTNGLAGGVLIPHGWHVALVNESGSSKEVQLSVVCADLP